MNCIAFQRKKRIFDCQPHILNHLNYSQTIPLEKNSNKKQTGERKASNQYRVLMKIFPNTPKNQKDKIHHELYENDKKKLFPLQLNEKNHQKSNKTEKKAKNRKKTARHHFNNNHQPNQSKAWPSVANLKGTAVRREGTYFAFVGLLSRIKLNCFFKSSGMTKSFGCSHEKSG